MPLTALRLVNKPGRKRRKPFPSYSSAGAKKTKRRNPVPQTRRKVLTRKKMGNGGYRWFYGGKLISNPQAKRVAAGRKAAAARKRAKAPVRKRRAAAKPKRSVRYTRATTRRKPARITPIRKRATTKRKPATRRRRTAAVARPVRNPKRKRVSAATRKKISAALKRHYRGTKRASNPPKKRRKAVAKKTTRRKTTRRRAPKRRARTSPSSRPRYGTKAYYSWMGKRAARKRKRKGVRSNPPKRRRKTTYKVSSTRYARKRPVYLRRKPRGPLKKHRIRRRTYKHRATGAKHYRYRIIKRNPGLKDIGQLFGKVLPIYGGFILSRIGASAIGQHVVPRLGGLQTTLGKAAPLLSPMMLLGLSVFLGPKVLKGKTGGQILEGLQLGSVLQIFDGIGKQFIAPALAGQPMLASAFGGYDDMGVLGYGAYMADPTGYSLPPAHATLEPGMGLDIHEAMALDSYVTDDGLGASVEEALADSESDYMQRGGAGGSLSKTVFTY